MLPENILGNCLLAMCLLQFVVLENAKLPMSSLQTESGSGKFRKRAEYDFGEYAEFLAELTELAAELSEFSLPKQYSRNSIPPVP